MKILQQLEHLDASVLPTAERNELISLAAALAPLRLGPGALQAALRRHSVIEDIIRESDLAQEFFAEGKAEGKRQFLRSVLQSRFGALSDDLTTAIEAADEAALSELAEYVAIETQGQIRVRLGLSEQQG